MSRRFLSLLVLACFCSALASAIPSTTCPTFNVEMKLEKEPELENTYKLMFINHDFNPNTNANAASSTPTPTFVELHWLINGKDGVNIRSTNEMTNPTIEQDGVVVKESDSIQYWATYGAKGAVNCDTELHNYKVVNDKLEPEMMNERETRTEHEVNAVGDEAQWGRAQRACPLIEFEQKLEKIPGTENAYTLEFTNKDARLNLDYIDLHYSINDGDYRNVRIGTDLHATGTKKVDESGIMLNPQDKLNYWYTYQVDKHACDTQKYQIVVPGNTNANVQASGQAQAQAQLRQVQGQGMSQSQSRGVCPLIEFEQRMEKMKDGKENEYQLVFINKDKHIDLDLLDLHFKVNDSDESNVRLGTFLTPADKTVEATGLTLNKGDTVKYWYTYAVNQKSCDTDKFSSQAL